MSFRVQFAPSENDCVQQEFELCAENEPSELGAATSETPLIEVDEEEDDGDAENGAAPVDENPADPEEDDSDASSASQHDGLMPAVSAGLQVLEKIRGAIMFSSSSSSSEEEHNTVGPSKYPPVSEADIVGPGFYKLRADIETNGVSQASTSRRSSVASILSKGHQYLYKRKNGRGKVSKGMPKRSLEKVFGNTGYYITDSFQKRVCSHFIPNSKIRNPNFHSSGDLNWCKCGLHSMEHTSKDAMQSIDAGNSSKPWIYNLHSELDVTDAYGQIDFVDDPLDTHPYYVRMDIDTPIFRIVDLLSYRWSLKTPNLILAIFGDGYRDISYSTMMENKEMFTELTNGLLKAAKTTDAWFTTTGLKCGANKLVGTAVGNNRSFVNSIPTIGFAPWGAVRDSSDLVHEDGCFPASYSSSARRHDENPTGNRRVPLESNHTHFLLFDKGIYETFYKADISKRRLEIEQAMVSAAGSQLVSVLISGDLNSLREARKRVEINCPIVVVKGSGRMADIICSAFESMDTHKLRRLSSWHGHMLPENAAEASLTLLRDAFPKRRDQDFVQQLEDIRFLFRKQEHITICDCNTESVDRVILSGLIRSMGALQHANQKQLTYHQLRLAILWNRLDLAVEGIFKNMTLSGNALDDLIFLAIQHNRVSFVRQFIQKGTTVTRFLTEGRFLDLLNSTSKGSFLRKLLSKQRARQRRRLMARNWFERLKTFSGPLPKSGLKRRMFSFKHFARVIYNISDGVYQCTRKQRTVRSKFGPKRGSTGSNKSHFEDPEVIIVLFCVLNNWHEMAKLFWEYTKTPAMLALVSCHINRWVAHMEAAYIEITPEMKPILKANADEFEDLAYRMLDEASQNYPTEWVHSLLTQNYYNWGGKTLLQIADYIEGYHFISHTAIQEYVTKEWMGMLEPDMKYWKIILVIPFPFLASFKKMTLSEIENNRISKQTDERRRRKLAFVSKRLEDKLALEQAKLTTKKLNFFQRIYYFYNAPVVKFFIYLMMYVAFLMLYSYALVARPPKGSNAMLRSDAGVATYTNMHFLGQSMSYQEFCVYLWVFSIIPVEIRQIFHCCPSTIWGKLKNYFGSSYNRADVISLVLISVAMFMRYFRIAPPSRFENGKMGLTEEEEIKQNEKYEEAIFRIFFALAFCGLCLRLAQAMQIHSKLGPKVMMVYSMFMDLVFFMCLLFMALLCYGVSTQALIYPNKKELSHDLVFKILWRPYLNMFGELDLDTLKEDINEGYCGLARRYNTSVTCTDAKTSYDCDGDYYCYYNKILVFVMLSVYMMLVAVMMLNLLVAVFTYTYDKMNLNSGMLWKWQRYDLVNEFTMRSALPIPLNTIILTLFFFRWVYRKCCGRLAWTEYRENQKKRHDHKQDRIALLEAECRRNLLDKMGQISEMEIVCKDVEICATNMQKLETAFGEFQKSLQGIVDKTVNRIPSATRPGLINFRHDEEEEDEVDGEAAAVLTYPGTKELKVFVEEKYLDWDVIYLDYAPKMYSDVSSPDTDLAMGLGATEDYNTGEKQSYEGSYLVQEGLPLNPAGRTGIGGRGKLANYGPNHLHVPLFTRVHEGRVEILVVEKHRDVYSLPEFPCTFTDTRPTEMRDIFKEANFLNFPEDSLLKLEKRVEKLFNRGVMLERGFYKSSYNTDNAWFEIVSYNYHDYDDKLLAHLSPQDGDYHWVEIDKTNFPTAKDQELCKKARNLRR